MCFKQGFLSQRLLLRIWYTHMTPNGSIPPVVGGGVGTHRVCGAGGGGAAGWGPGREIDLVEVLAGAFGVSKMSQDVQIWYTFDRTGHIL